jgi:hypothetical protein
MREKGGRTGSGREAGQFDLNHEMLTLKIGIWDGRKRSRRDGAANKGIEPRMADGDADGAMLDSTVGFPSLSYLAHTWD